MIIANQQTRKLIFISMLLSWAVCQDPIISTWYIGTRVSGGGPYNHYIELYNPTEEMMEPIIKAWEKSDGFLPEVHKAAIEVAFNYSGKYNKFQNFCFITIIIVSIFGGILYFIDHYNQYNKDNKNILEFLFKYIFMGKGSRANN